MRAPDACMLIACAVLAACSRQAVVVSPTMLHSYVNALRLHGHATIPLEPDGAADLALGDRVAVRLHGETRDLAIASLIAGCPDARPFAQDRVTWAKYPACVLMQTRQPIVVDHRRVGYGRTIAAVLAAVGILAVTGVVVGYLADCAGPDDGC